MCRLCHKWTVAALVGGLVLTTVGTNCARHDARHHNPADERFDELLAKLTRETPEGLTVLLTNDPAVRDQLSEAVTHKDACQRIGESLGNRTINTDWLNALLTFVPSERLTKWLQSEGDTMALDFKAAVIAALIEVPLVNNTPHAAELRWHIESLSNGGSFARLVYCKYGDADQVGFHKTLVACLQDAALSDRDIQGLVLVRHELLKSIDLDSLGLPAERKQVITDAMNQADRKKETTIEVGKSTGICAKLPRCCLVLRYQPAPCWLDPDPGYGRCRRYGETTPPSLQVNPAFRRGWPVLHVAGTGSAIDNSAIPSLRTRWSRSM